MPREKQRLRLIQERCRVKMPSMLHQGAWQLPAAPQQETSLLLAARPQESVHQISQIRQVSVLLAQGPTPSLSTLSMPWHLPPGELPPLEKKLCLALDFDQLAAAVPGWAACPLLPPWLQL